jgi:hypothetical protein
MKTNERNDRTTINLRPHARLSRSDRLINTLRPLSYNVGNPDFDVVHVHIYDDQRRICMSLITASGTATFTMPISVAHEVGEGLASFAKKQEAIPAKER